MRIARIIAAVLGGTLALWLAQGDTSGTEFIASCHVEHMDTWDSRGVQFFLVKCGTVNGQFTITADKDLPIATWLAGRKDRISVALGGRE